jgi:hypothetical protein
MPPPPFRSTRRRHQVIRGNPRFGSRVPVSMFSLWGVPGGKPAFASVGSGTWPRLCALAPQTQGRRRTRVRPGKRTACALEPWCSPSASSLLLEGFNNPWAGALTPEGNICEEEAPLRSLLHLRLRQSRLPYDLAMDLVALRPFEGPNLLDVEPQDMLLF